MKKKLFLLIFSLYCFVSAEKIPERIVSLGPAITEDIFLLGKGDKIIGNTIYCTRPEEAKYKEKVGNVIDVNIEKIYSLKPDIVFATNLTNPKDVKKLRDLGIRVEIISYSLNFKQLCNDFIKIGKIIGKEKEAKEIVEKVKREIEEIKKKSKRKKPKVLIQVGTRPLWVAGTDSFVNDIIEFTGGENVIKGKGGIYSMEEIIKLNPEIIIITTMGIDTEEEKKNWKKYNMIDAVKNDKIFVVDSDKICSPTPLSFVEVVKELRRRTGFGND
ncbi:MAG TPA: helical backbone metal receptor [bacterium]|nr:helical backbone metal receptor [bacterium]HOM26246.1 helical backbone metal receptor [bacterium]